ncbi:hypothetical protein, partial [Mesorhizobium sp. M4A.F.Ca.ET.020.02.1.1]|uniref:hypothetical protein n=1 Tax=Mesorhizobium sp. M4A.F.Ca.ET.020.02.1.1 TaxID=2496652 RepID=UPI001AECB155
SSRSANTNHALSLGTLNTQRLCVQQQIQNCRRRKWCFRAEMPGRRSDSWPEAGLPGLRTAIFM